MPTDVRGAFPCAAVPDTPQMARLLGLYPQRVDGRWMQRVRVPGGRLSSAQWRGLGRVAEEHTPGVALHLTTRQDVELHDVASERVPTVQRELAGLGLSTVGSCGDTLRNVTTCPGGGVCRGTRDVAPLGAALCEALEAHDSIYALPRKFKISLSGCEKACARPYIADLAFVALSDGRFRAIGAGSLGPRPGLGVGLYDSLGPGEAVPLALAAIELFLAEGDRTNRQRARLRHVRERLGDGEFRARLDSLFREQRSRWRGVPTSCPAASGEGGAAVRLQFRLGDVTARQAALIADVADVAGAAVRIDLDHGVLVYGVPGGALPGDLAALAGAPRVVSCPGAAFCVRAIGHCRGVAEAVSRELAGGAGSELAVRISGCPNGCAQSAVSDIGLVARIRRRGEGQVECYQVFVGGDACRPGTEGRALGEPVAAEAVAGRVAAVAAAHAELGDWQRVVDVLGLAPSDER